MEDAVSALAARILAKLHAAPPTERIIVGIAGVPGSGKSTLAYPLVDRLNALLGIPVREPSRIDAEELVATPGRDQVEAVAVAVGLDGWHFTRAELDTFPDPAEARRRRGAAFTFDSVAYTSFVLSLRKIPLLPSIPFPTFSHSLKDPTLSPFTIKPHHRIVVIEGLYCLLDVEPWKSSVDVLDERVWVECERAVARERLVRRHLKEGVEDQLDKAEGRVDGSDMINGEFIREHLVEPTVSFDSIDDPTFAMAALSS